MSIKEKKMKNDRPVTIVVLSKYKEIFKGFFDSVEAFAPKNNRVLVSDGEEVKEYLENLQKKPAQWNVVVGPAKFSMAGNANLGLKAVPEDHDILYCGDDVRFFQENTVER